MAGTITYNTRRKDCTHIFRATTGGTVFSANLLGTAFDYFLDAPTADDAIYFLSSTGGRYLSAGVEIDVATAMAGTDIVLAWEYWTRFDTWEPVTGLEDDTVALTSTGANQKVYHPRSPFYDRVTVNSIAGNMHTRCRLVSFSAVTEGGANTDDTPQFMDGMIQLHDYTEEVPCTLEEIYDYMTTNYPSVGVAYGDLGKKEWFFANSGIDTSDDGYLELLNETLKLGNGSTAGNYAAWDQNDFYFLTAGTKVGTDKFKDGCTILYCDSVGAAWLGTYTNTKMYGVQIRKGTYSLVVGGALRSYSGAAYTALSWGEYIGVTVDIAGTGYWSGTGLVLKNCFLRSHFNVTTTFAEGQTFENVSVYNFEAVELMQLYGGVGTGELSGFGWYLPSGSLFRVRIDVAGTVVYNFLNPSPQFPELDASPKYLSANGYPLNIYWNIYERYTFDLKVVGIAGTGIAGATVVMVDVDETEVDGSPFTTDADGDIAQTKCLKSHGHSDGVDVLKDEMNPYTVTVSKVGYRTKAIKYTIVQKTEEVLLLEAYAAPVAAFTAYPVDEYSPETVQFADESTGVIDTYAWDFGDDGESADQSPTHEYTSAGTYTVVLTVTGPGGEDAETKVDFITIGAAPTRPLTGAGV